MDKAVLLLSCPDQKALVAKLSGFISEHGGNIFHSDHHIDHAANMFLSRIEWDLKSFDLDRHKLKSETEKLTSSLSAQWSLKFPERRKQVAIFVTKQDHCLVDLLWRHEVGEFNADIPLVISNHETLREQTERFGVKFVHIPISEGNRAEAEREQLDLLKDHKIDVVVLAKYMQVLSPDFLASNLEFINIHHSFLPSFAGGRPYHRAFDRGVKLIGATAHYVTADLDEGPIIEQDVQRISHRHQVDDMVRLGKDLEKIVLSRALRLHLEHRVLVYNNKTVVFD